MMSALYIPSLFKMGYPDLIFLRFKQRYQIETVDSKRIQTRIVGVKGKHADDWTTTTYKIDKNLSRFKLSIPN